MAKKTKTARKTKKAAEAKKGAKTSAKVKPTYMTGDKPLRIALHDVIKAIQEIEDEGHLVAFVRAAKKQAAMVQVEPATVNFVKSFMATKKMQHREIARHIINPKAPDAHEMVVLAAAGPAKDPFECDLSKH